MSVNPNDCGGPLFNGGTLCGSLSCDSCYPPAPEPKPQTRVRKLADLKRLPIGTKVRLVRCLVGDVNKGRTLVGVQSNALLFEPDDKPGGRSYLYLPKAADFRATPEGWQIMEGLEVAAEYVFAEALP